MRRLAVTGAALAAAVWSLPAHGEAAVLQPYQMVRSLQLVQDRLADGDDTALPMQQRLLEIIDERLRSADAETFADERNFRALFIYAMSGGNPTTVDLLLARMDLGEDDRRLGDGIEAYIGGNLHRARGLLGEIDPMTLDPEVGGFVALVRGAVEANQSPEEALKLLDQARLLRPGTLVEEAALRRSIPVSAALRTPSASRARP